MGLITIVLITLAISAPFSYPIVKKFGPKGYYFGAAVLAATFAALTTLLPKVKQQGTIYDTISWIPEINLNIVLRVDGFSLAMAMLVAGVGSLVMLYSRWYFSDNDSGLARFSAVFLGFAVSMLGLVVGDNVYLLFAFWEATTILSFMLIAQKYRLAVARSAAFQALILTTFGGLIMLVGLVLISNQTGSASLTEIISIADPSNQLIQISILLILIGALSKSAIFPFHFWLPAAMAAPTPVSAYLHAAAMVKAGIFLIALIGPILNQVFWLQIMLVALGGATMIWGALRAMRQEDLKLLVAHGTVSQLGMLTMLFGMGNTAISASATILLFAHAVAKAPLFLVVGVIDHIYTTRDIHKLSRVGKNNKLLTAVAIVAAASMAGAPITIGFVAKESVLYELIQLSSSNSLAIVSLIIFVLGSILTVAYMMKYLWGAFATKQGTPATKIIDPVSKKVLIAPAVLVILALLGGVFSNSIPISGLTQGLSLWHGFTWPLAITTAVLTLGIFLFIKLKNRKKLIPSYPERATATHIYWVITRSLDLGALRLTTLTQRGSLPFYLTIMFATFAAMIVWLLAIPGTWPTDFKLMDSWIQIPIALVIMIAAVRAAQAMTRFKAVILVGVIGYAMAAIFALHGAPDLALTQALVETITLIAFILVIRRLPINISTPKDRMSKTLRVVIAAVISLGVGIVALVALGARTAIPVSADYAEMAVTGGHGLNIVNVILVDIRGWDTLGELSVVLAAATGVASLVFLSTRGDNLPKLGRKEAQQRVRKHLRKVADPNDATSNAQWLLAGMSLDSRNRSIILEVVVRIIFHALMILSVYLLLVGHNSPGGGFAGGLVAGLALVARYLAGGRTELGATVTLDAGRILGAGLAISVLTALVPLFFGQAALTSSWIDLDLGPLGEISLVTSTFFDIGVYLVVFGLVLDVLRSLGAEIDEHIEQEAKL